MRGLSFEIPNKYGRFLFDILSAIDIKNDHWRVGGGEAYYIEADQLGAPLFLKSAYTGDELYETLTANDYYVIFADLKAFPQQADVQEIPTYEAFVTSRCEFVLLIVDCAYVTLYAKSEQAIKQLYTQAITAGYTEVTYITDDNDDRTTLVAF